MLKINFITFTALFTLFSLSAANPKTPDISKSDALEKLYETDYSTYIGNKDAEIIIFDFFDYNCGDCKNIAAALEQITEKNSAVKVVYIDYPILRPPSMYAAQISAAAISQGKYIEIHNAFMAHQGRLSSNDEIDAIAEKYGIDVSKIKDDDSVKSYLFKNLELGHKLGITNIPTLFIGKTDIPHNTSVIVEPSPEELNALLDKYLN